MRAVAGECGDESRATACFKGAWTWGVHVLVARSARSGRASSESARLTTSLIGTVMPYDENGHVCVRCMVLCIVLRVPGGRRVSHITCRDGSATSAFRVEADTQSGPFCSFKIAQIELYHVQ